MHSTYMPNFTKIGHSPWLSDRDETIFNAAAVRHLDSSQKWIFTMSGRQRPNFQHTNYI